MRWIFERNGERLRCEISRNDETGGYRLVLTQPDGTTSVEDLEQPTALINRSVDLMSALRRDGWQSPSGN